jgi:hypothetical protein
VRERLKVRTGHPEAARCGRCGQPYESGGACCGMAGDRPEMEALARKICTTVELLDYAVHHKDGRPDVEPCPRCVAIAAFLRQHDQQTRKLLDGIHEALGEDPASDDASLPGVIAEMIRDLRLLDDRAETFRREAASLRERLKVAEQMAEALDDLMGCQNGVPLIRHEKEWNRAMEAAESALVAWRAATP